MTVLVEMVSDLVCPWCWLGLRRLYEAMHITQDEFRTEVIFRTYQLDPTVPAEGMPYKDYMTAKFGGVGEAEASAQKDRFSAMREALEQYGEAEGIPFHFSGIPMRPNTINAHRLLRWAQGQDNGLAAKEALFKAYFTDHRDIGDLETLADIGEDIGLNRALVADLLKGDADLENVQQEEAMFRQVGITGVPTFIANRKVLAQGAEDAEKLANFLRTAANEYPMETAS
ncbi:DsbA family oxidoreductase [Ponticaulis sp.]|uniref:DsbA family oxidoreductase n=1 Tax=Ponticaulis sp. TaxID=2020902 RepID=UPI000B6BAD8B|nr:DsbA family oxidoreductase [Ponticaulis sp.]MAI88915.1 disulfide bond formation protein DsbA [Ponticaulis sp.]OUY01604.1 MAG: disulfide bond formation protein DsbA [Hyphomonadaceae bacterium TMED5]|tara:strand:- start:35835 stop:36518 length:684 start_codon:yes stop_codon:yes gene_type:complete